MTTDEMNIAIAEACGKTYHKPTEVEIESGSYCQYEPQYCRDLNAMHEAEAGLTPSQCDIYECLLDCSPLASAGPEERMFHKTAREKAEAFLKTIAKWK